MDIKIDLVRTSLTRYLYFTLRFGRFGPTETDRRKIAELSKDHRRLKDR